MKIKTRASKFCSKRQRVTSTTTRIVPPLNLETNNTLITDSTDDEIDTSPNNNDDDDDEVGVFDSIDKTCRNRREEEDMDLFDSDSYCVKCDDRGGDLLVCFNSDCPVAIHKDCLGECKAKYDINGDFYCPYCWYKMLVSKTKELRCKAMLAKVGLSSFIDSKAGAGAAADGNGNADGDRDRGKEEENGKVSSVQGAEILVTLSGRMVDRNVCDSANKSEGSKPVDRGQGERVNEEPIQEKSSAFCLAESEGKGESNLDKFGANGDEIVMEGLKEADSGEHERVDEDHHENEVLEKEEPVKAKPSVEVSNNVFLSVEDSGKTTTDERISNVPETTTLNKEDDIVPEKPTEDHVSYESSESYNVPHERLVKKISKRKAEVVQNVRKSPSQHMKCRIVNSPKRNSPRLNSPASGSTTNQSKNPITLRQPHQPTSKLSSFPGYKEIRKRIVFTPEEEEMLKEGVQHFAPSVNKNIPWRKILEYGRDVFDPTRNPGDLKDKWKLLLRNSSIDRDPND